MTFETKQKFARILYDNAVSGLTYTTSGHRPTVDPAFIISQLIKDTGRFTKYSQHTLFNEWQKAEQTIRNGLTETQLFLFGIRQYGVDDISSIISHTKHYICHNIEQNVYHKIYALLAEADENNNITLTFKDVTVNMAWQKELKELLISKGDKT